MAKNKNRKQDAQPSRRPQAEEQEQRNSPESQSPMSQPQGSPADVARKKQKSFGHN
ncbi:hypothetical protein ACH40E_10010 [Streptomyces acidicola]|uniref:hypothetical protein n=1 Tax=Streptomyces acidicola TaxID=2596892 RepID=UPI0037B88253